MVPTLHAPPGTPPNWVFAPVWIGAVRDDRHRRRGWSGDVSAPPRPLRLWGWQLAANALWAPAFFGLHSPALAMGVIVVLLLLIALTIRSFRRIHRIAAFLMVPYGAWCLYAAYLNAGFLILNPV